LCTNVAATHAHRPWRPAPIHQWPRHLAPANQEVAALAPRFSRVLEGFGELFRHLSYFDIGPSTMQSRAVAGVLGETLVFCLLSMVYISLAIEHSEEAH
jgi:hypothetical protein